MWRQTRIISQKLVSRRTARPVHAFTFRPKGQRCEMLDFHIEELSFIRLVRLCQGLRGVDLMSNDSSCRSLTDFLLSEATYWCPMINFWKFPRNSGNVSTLSNNDCCIPADELSQMSFMRSCENTGLLAVTPVYRKQRCGSRYGVLTVGRSKGRKSNKRSVSIHQRTAEHQEWSQSQVDGTPDRSSSLHHAAAFLFPGWLDSFSPQPWAKQATSKRMNFESHSAVGHSNVRLSFFSFYSAICFVPVEC